MILVFWLLQPLCVSNISEISAQISENAPINELAFDWGPHNDVSSSY